MKLHHYLAIERGRAVRLAYALELPPSLISQWATASTSVHKRPIPVVHRPSIERETGGKVTCEELGDDVVWLRVPDKRWVWHRRGRPALDVTRTPR